MSVRKTGAEALKQKKHIRHFLVLASAILLLIIIGTIWSINTTKEPSPCEGRQWKSPEEYSDCKFPDPPIGRWKAVYTKKFAKKHNLPLENISTDLSYGVDYMEMDVLPYGNNGVACLVNMLIKKPHDIALFNLSSMGVPVFHKERKLIRLIDIDQHKKRLKSISTFSSASRDYKLRKQGYEGSTFAFYSEDVLPGYDYVAVNKRCSHVSLAPQYFPNGYAFWVNKASIWGQYEGLYPRLEDPGRPRGDKDFYNSHFFINIPHELISNIFKDVPLGGR